MLMIVKGELPSCWRWIEETGVCFKRSSGKLGFFLERSKFLLGVGTSKISKVEKKSNLDVLDKRGWNVVIYAIETQMLTDAGS